MMMQTKQLSEAVFNKIKNSTIYMNYKKLHLNKMCVIKIGKFKRNFTKAAREEVSKALIFFSYLLSF